MRVERLSRRWIVTLDLAAWAATAFMGSLALTQAAGYTGLTVVYVLQALTPFLLTPAVPLAAVACLTRRHVIALTNVAIAASLLVLCAPVVFHPAPSRPATDAPILRIAQSNAYFKNATPNQAAITLMALDVDVLAVTEYDVDVAKALTALGVDNRYPFRVDHAPNNRNGVALFSRYRIIASTVEPIGGQFGVNATIDLDGTEVRIIVVHPLPGVDRSALAQWHRDLATFADLATSPGPPTVMVGDFNSSRWHPAFREMLDDGLIDAHEQLGRGFSRSWPNGSLIPRFVRLDHALLGHGVSAVSIRDLKVPGSDHLGFVVEVAITAR
jgi:endonuclease/exonuclease/phosphatase (EEP) superfamily protein YafD